MCFFPREKLCYNTCLLKGLTEFQTERPGKPMTISPHVNGSHWVRFTLSFLDYELLDLFPYQSSLGWPDFLWKYCFNLSTYCNLAIAFYGTGRENGTGSFIVQCCWWDLDLLELFCAYLYICSSYLALVSFSTNRTRASHLQSINVCTCTAWGNCSWKGCRTGQMQADNWYLDRSLSNFLSQLPPPKGIISWALWRVHSAEKVRPSSF